MSEMIQRQTEVPSALYGYWEPSFDRHPDERRWAKRFALYRLRSLIRSFALEYDIVVVRDLQILEKRPALDCGQCLNSDPYTWAWKCRFTLANR